MIVDHATYAPKETGGVMMGYWVSHNEVVVIAATSAGPNAKHLKDGYEPDVEHDAREIATIYETSGRLHAYLGDWHTHPDSSPALSRKDRQTLASIATDTGARVETPIMVIVAETEEDFQVVTWCLHVGSRTPAPMTIRLFA